MKKNSQKSQFLIAAPSSGSGKTTMTLGLIRAIARKGLAVQPFKCGPDYIDTMHHSIAADRPSINLDLFLSDRNHVQSLFNDYKNDCASVIVEGVMGLFDGADKAKGSSAEIAQLLNLPIVLIVNAKATAYSIAPLLYGFKSFNKNITIAGVIFNNVNTESHYKLLTEAAADVGVESFGFVPRNSAIEFKSRHLGLEINTKERIAATIERIADHIETYVDIDLLLDKTQCSVEEPAVKEQPSLEQKITVAVAQDEAFNFAYAANLAALEHIANIVYFSPLNDLELPPADLLYFAGGYPECYLSQLAENKAMKLAIKKHADIGGAVLAECGGMMYLSKSVIDQAGKEYEMVGILDQKATMENMKLTLGYRTLFYNQSQFRGHEFHYSKIIEGKENSAAENVETARSKPAQTLFIAKNNVRASYIHFYWANCCLDFFRTMFPKLIEKPVL